MYEELTTDDKERLREFLVRAAEFDYAQITIKRDGDIYRASVNMAVEPEVTPT
jgi:hypothetical protein